jgi:hypothetical protein
LGGLGNKTGSVRFYSIPDDADAGNKVCDSFFSEAVCICTEEKIPHFKELNSFPKFDILLILTNSF